MKNSTDSDTQRQFTKCCAIIRVFSKKYNSKNNTHSLAHTNTHKHLNSTIFKKKYQKIKNVIDNLRA